MPTSKKPGNTSTVWTEYCRFQSDADGDLEYVKAGLA